MTREQLAVGAQLVWTVDDERFGVTILEVSPLGTDNLALHYVKTRDGRKMFVHENELATW